ADDEQRLPSSVRQTVSSLCQPVPRRCRTEISLCYKFNTLQPNGIWYTTCLMKREVQYNMLRQLVSLLALTAMSSVGVLAVPPASKISKDLQPAGPNDIVDIL